MNRNVSLAVLTGNQEYLSRLQLIPVGTFEPAPLSFSLVYNWDWTRLFIRSLNLKDPVTDDH